MDDIQAMNHGLSDVDRNSSGGAVPAGVEADQPDQRTVDDWSDDEAGSRIDVGVLVAHSPGGDVKPLRSFAERSPQRVYVGTHRWRNDNDFAVLRYRIPLG